MLPHFGCEVGCAIGFHPLNESEEFWSVKCVGWDAWSAAWRRLVQFSRHSEYKMHDASWCSRMPFAFDHPNLSQLWCLRSRHGMGPRCRPQVILVVAKWWLAARWVILGALGRELFASTARCAWNVLMDAWKQTAFGNDWRKPSTFWMLEFVDLADKRCNRFLGTWTHLNSWVEGARILDVFHVSQLDFVSLILDAPMLQAGCWVPWMAWLS